jgi:hypothetical protein
MLPICDKISEKVICGRSHENSIINFPFSSTIFFAENVND